MKQNSGINTYFNLKLDDRIEIVMFSVRETCQIKHGLTK